jgi:hypothetical protein
MKSRILTIGIAFLLLSCLQEDGSIPSTERLASEIKKIDEYLAANPGDPDDIIVKDASGVRIVITELGPGPFPPNSGNNLKAAYTGRLFSNELFSIPMMLFILKLLTVSSMDGRLH